ncbi:MAG: hypothetical protein JWM25_1128 [Thermoleophilia bacterium]|nr:hypothetical protein [Thermoleophilia bacterium]MCZ4496545.1 hypothetical protein [Thermoleophilia bacterium]
MYVTWYTAMSIDGRIAGPGDDLSFLALLEAAGEHEAEFAEFIATIDAIVIGSATQRWLVKEGQALPHRGLPIWLVSHDVALAEAAAAADADTPVTRVEGDIAPILDAIEAAGHERIWICGGGDIAGQALAVDRVDELLLTMAPTVLGSGPTVFDAAALERRLFTLEELRRYGANGVRMRWLRDRSAT